MLPFTEHLTDNFALQLLLAQCLFLGKLETKKNFYTWFIPEVAGICVVASIFPEIFIDGWINIFYSFVFVLTILIFWQSCNCEIGTVIFCCTVAYAIQHLAFNLECVFYVLVGPEKYAGMLFQSGLYVFGHYDTHSYGWWSILLNLMIYVSVYSICYRFFIRHLSKTDFLEFQYAPQVLLGLGIIAFTYGVNAVFCCVMVLLLYFGIISQKNFQKERAQMEAMLRVSERQQQITRENIDIINIKCHDLRKQVKELKYFSDQKENIREIEKAIDIYNSVVKTGNEALDIVLTEKSLLCERNEIRFTYMVDGAALSFINYVDIYALFGNALDNAIEAVSGVEDKERRIITLNVKMQGRYLKIFMDNYCEKVLEYKNGFPVTTKEDKDFHGFGTRSIVYIARKYHGKVEMYQADDRFCLDIKIPTGK